jgi:hypothetical protein
MRNRRSAVPSLFSCNGLSTGLICQQIIGMVERSEMAKQPTLQFEDALYFLAQSLLVSAAKFNRCLSSAHMMGLMEKRLAQRRRVLKAEVIVSPGGTFNCMVRNLSEQGAALDLPSLIAIPDDFTLVIPTEGARFFCQAVWRNERRIGVAFASLH